MLFMVLEGLPMKPSLVRSHLPLASPISGAGVVLPLVLEQGRAWVMEHWQPDLLPGARSGGLNGVARGVQRAADGLFLGTAQAITAIAGLAPTRRRAT
jgi:hypothetical protein